MGKSSPERALAAYFRQMARQQYGTIPLNDLPTQACEETLDVRELSTGSSLVVYFG
jgi:hypothetical protein